MKSHVKFKFLAMFVMQALLEIGMGSKSTAKNVELSSLEFDLYKPLMGNSPEHPIEFLMQELDRMHPTVQSHTFAHMRWRNLIMYFFIGLMFLQCTIGGVFYSLFFDIQGWYWDCLDNTRVNLILI